MKKQFLASLLIWLLAVTAPSVANAQNAITLPMAAAAVADVGNGPIKVRVTAGNASIFTSQATGLTFGASVSSTALTLTAVPTTAPCVGCIISGNGITSGTTVASYNGVTQLGLSAAMSVPASTTVSWGAACPASAAGIPSAYIPASAMADYYLLYTQARVCAISPGGPVNTLLILPIFYESTTPSGSSSGGSGSVASVFGRTGAVVAAGGDYVTSQVTESGSLYYTNARGIGSTLTGYVSGAGTVGAADSILQAIQKLNGNTAALVTGVSSVFGRTGAVVAANNDYNFTNLAGSIAVGQIPAGLIVYSKLQNETANTILGNPTSGAAAPAEITMGSCSGSNNASIWTTNVGFGCKTDVASLTATSQTLTGGANVTAGNLGTRSSGTETINCGNSPLQYITNNGPFTLAAPASDGSCVLLVTNGASASSITLSGFSNGTNTGDALTTTNTNKFSIFIWRVNGTAGSRVAAHQ